MKFVRIRPRDERRGQLVRRYVYGGFRFEADHGWYEVDDEIAEYLATVRTHQQDPDSKPVFDVSDQEGAERIARSEYEDANPERKIAEAVAGAQTVKAADLDLGGVKAAGAPAPAVAADAEPAGETKKPVAARASGFQRKDK